MANPSRSQGNSRLSTLPSQKPRQLSHLQAQLAQLTANVADLENLMRMTAIQAQSMRELGGYSGGMWVFLFWFPSGRWMREEVRYGEMAN